MTTEYDPTDIVEEIKNGLRTLDEEEENLLILRDQLAKIKRIREEQSKKDSLIQVLRERVAVLEHEKQVNNRQNIEIQEIMTERIQTLEKSLYERDELERKYISFQTRFESIESERNDIEDQLLMEKKSHAETKAFCAEQQADITSLRTAVENDKRVTEQTHVLFKALKEELVSKDEALARLKDAHSETVQHLQKEVKVSRHSAKELAIKLQAAEERCCDVEETFRRAVKDLDALRVECQAQRTEAQRWQSAYADLEKAVHTLRAQSSTAHFGVTQELTEVQSELTHCKREYERAKSEVLSYQKLLAALAGDSATAVGGLEMPLSLAQLYQQRTTVVSALTEMQKAVALAPFASDDVSLLLSSISTASVAGRGNGSSGGAASSASTAGRSTGRTLFQSLVQFMASTSHKCLDYQEQLLGYAAGRDPSSQRVRQLEEQLQRTWKAQAASDDLVQKLVQQLGAVFISSVGDGNAYDGSGIGTEYRNVTFSSGSNSKSKESTWYQGNRDTGLPPTARDKLLEDCLKGGAGESEETLQHRAALFVALRKGVAAALQKTAEMGRQLEKQQQVQEEHAEALQRCHTESNTIRDKLNAEIDRLKNLNEEAAVAVQVTQYETSSEVQHVRDDYEQRYSTAVKDHEAEVDRLQRVIESFSAQYQQAVLSLEHVVAFTLPLQARYQQLAEAYQIYAALCEEHYGTLAEEVMTVAQCCYRDSDGVDPSQSHAAVHHPDRPSYDFTPMLDAAADEGGGAGHGSGTSYCSGSERGGGDGSSSRHGAAVGRARRHVVPSLRVVVMMVLAANRLRMLLRQGPLRCAAAVHTALRPIGIRNQRSHLPHQQGTGSGGKGGRGCGINDHELAKDEDEDPIKHLMLASSRVGGRRGTAHNMRVRNDRAENASGTGASSSRHGMEEFVLSPTQLQLPTLSELRESNPEELTARLLVGAAALADAPYRAVRQELNRRTASRRAAAGIINDGEDCPPLSATATASPPLSPPPPPTPSETAVGGSGSSGGATDRGLSLQPHAHQHQHREHVMRFAVLGVPLRERLLIDAIKADSSTFSSKGARSSDGASGRYPKTKQLLWYNVDIGAIDTVDVYNSSATADSFGYTSVGGGGGGGASSLHSHSPRRQQQTRDLCGRLHLRRIYRTLRDVKRRAEASKSEARQLQTIIVSLEERVRGAEQERDRARESLQRQQGRLEQLEREKRSKSWTVLREVHEELRRDSAAVAAAAGVAVDVTALSRVSSFSTGSGGGGIDERHASHNASSVLYAFESPAATGTGAPGDSTREFHTHWRRPGNPGRGPGGGPGGDPRSSNSSDVEPRHHHEEHSQEHRHHHQKHHHHHEHHQHHQKHNQEHQKHHHQHQEHNHHHHDHQQQHQEHHQYQTSELAHTSPPMVPPPRHPAHSSATDRTFTRTHEPERQHRYSPRADHSDRFNTAQTIPTIQSTQSTQQRRGGELLSSDGDAIYSGIQDLLDDPMHTRSRSGSDQDDDGAAAGDDDDAEDDIDGIGDESSTHLRPEVLEIYSDIGRLTDELETKLNNSDYELVSSSHGNSSASSRHSRHSEHSHHSHASSHQSHQSHQSHYDRHHSLHSQRGDDHRSDSGSRSGSGSERSGRQPDSSALNDSYESYQSIHSIDGCGERINSQTSYSRRK